jgi:Asp-tRNA(Asn)/Glu-tRNA(Gln) amidotransferase C subunit
VFKWFQKSGPSQADLEREAFLTTLSAIAQAFSSAQEATNAAVSQMAKASEAQANAMREHLALFSVQNLPTSRVMRDADELRAEIARTADFPHDASPREQALWVLSASNNPDD